MADKNKLAEMLENLVNDNTERAEEIFHEYVVEKSREIYEELIESELDEETDEESDDDSEVEESFEDFDVSEGDDETDDLVSDVEADDDMGDDDMGDDEGEEDLEGRIMNLEDQIEELEAEFAKIKGDDDMGDDDMGDDDMGDDEEMKDDFDFDMTQVNDLETVREYVEKVPAGHGAEKKGTGEASGANTRTPVAGKNDMGGTTANIAKGGEGGGKDAGLANSKAKDMNTGNINVPGGKAGSAFNKKEPGHGAEKKGAGENADNKTSLFRK